MCNENGYLAPAGNNEERPSSGWTAHMVIYDAKTDKFYFNNGPER